MFHFIPPHVTIAALQYPGRCLPIPLMPRPSRPAPLSIPRTIFLVIHGSLEPNLPCLLMRPSDWPIRLYVPNLTRLVMCPGIRPSMCNQAKIPFLSFAFCLYYPLEKSQIITAFLVCVRRRILWHTHQIGINIPPVQCIPNLDPISQCVVTDASSFRRCLDCNASL